MRREQRKRWWKKTTENWFYAERELCWRTRTRERTSLVSMNFIRIFSFECNWKLCECMHAKKNCYKKYGVCDCICCISFGIQSCTERRRFAPEMCHRRLSACVSRAASYLRQCAMKLFIQMCHLSMARYGAHQSFIKHCRTKTIFTMTHIFFAWILLFSIFLTNRAQWVLFRWRLACSKLMNEWINIRYVSLKTVIILRGGDGDTARNVNWSNKYLMRRRINCDVSNAFDFSKNAMSNVHAKYVWDWFEHGFVAVNKCAHSHTTPPVVTKQFSARGTYDESSQIGETERRRAR